MHVKSVADSFFYITVKIKAIYDNGFGTGTGFFFAYPLGNNEYSFFIVTNKHVIDGAVKGQLTFHINDNGQPKEGEFFVADIEPHIWQQVWYGHPDKNIDIAICCLPPISEFIKEKFGTEIFVRALRKDDIPNSEILADLDSVEDIIFVGYPNSIWDETHKLPIVRRGITASPLQVDFNNEPKFIIDASVFGGSSGSPVFIYNKNFYNSRSLGTVQGSRLLFLGVIAEVFHRTTINDIRSVPVLAVADKQVVIQKEMIDLGIVFKARTVIEAIESYFDKEGIKYK